MLVWTQWEDDTLRKLVKENGENAWHKICKEMPNKTEIRCFHRWRELKAQKASRQDDKSMLPEEA